MILTCPSCATSYSVDEAKLGPAGRVARRVLGHLQGPLPRVLP